MIVCIIIVLGSYVFIAEDAQLADSTLDELLRFIAGLRVKRIIKKAESDALEEMLFNNRWAPSWLCVLYVYLQSYVYMYAWMDGWM